VIGAMMRATPTLLRVGFARTIAYRAEMTIWILTALMPLVMLALWNAVAKDSPVAGYNQVELTRYFTVALIVRQMTGSWIVWMLNWEIRSGQLSPQLLRPVPLLWNDAIWTLSAIPLRVIVLTPLVAALVWWRPDLVAFPGWPAVGLFFVSVFAAWMIHFVFQCIIGMLAFWLDQTDGLFGVWFTLYSLLSGYVAPLETFPVPVQHVIRFLPFRGMMATPVSILGGFVSPSDALPDVGIQIVWVAIMLALARLVWRRGLARYGAFGA
jgi:ABC-2 type transport system permease protein